MKDFVLKRPLFIACFTAVLFAVLCVFLDISGMIVCLCSLMFALLLVLPVKFGIKKSVLLAILLSMLIIASSLLYYVYDYSVVLSYSEMEKDLQCVAISKVQETTNGYCVDAKCYDPEKNSTFKATIYFDDNMDILPSCSFNAHVIFSDDNKANRFSDIHLSSFAKDISSVSEPNKYSFHYIIYSVNKAVTGSLTGVDSDTYAFINGMLFGDKGEISGVFKNKFTTIGMSHVMAVSGMHLMFSVVFMDFLLMLMGISYKPRSVFAILSALAFTIISGMSVSCIRAFIMIAVYYNGRLINKMHDSLTSLGFSAFLILLFSPYNIGNVSFILSVFATFGLIVITPILNNLVNIDTGNHMADNILYILKGSLTMSLGANIACIPVFICVFKTVSLVSPIANIILIVPIQLMFHLSILCVLLSFIPPVKTFLLYVLDKLYNLIDICVDFIFNLKYISFSTEDIFFYLVFALLFVLILGIFVYNAKFKNKHILIYIGMYAALCIALFCCNLFMNKDVIRLDFVDVGQGSMSVITKQERAVVFDSGGSEGDNIDDAFVGPNVKKIELVALTHTDNDHVNFLTYLINSYEIDKIIYPDMCDTENIEYLLDIARENGTDIEAFSKDHEITVLDDAIINVFIEEAYRVKPNSNVGALYKFCYGGTKVAFTGDMSIYEEYAFLDYGEQLDCDILLVPHHGSPKSLSPSIFELYSPEYSVISVAKDNGYGLPDARIIKRLESTSEILQTSELSTITFKLYKEGYSYINNEYKDNK